MVINASSIFECNHLYVAVKEGGVLMFACASCGYRTELLPLHLHASSGAARRRIQAVVMLFRHPHLVRGIVHTPHGAFMINRGLAELPEEIGESSGWPRIEQAYTPRAPGRDASTSEQPTLRSIDGR